MDAVGQVTDEYTRNGVETVSVRNPSTGWLLGSTVTAHADNDAVIQDWTFRFDEIRNLRSRTRSGAGVASETLESFEYDKLDRLTLSRVQTSSGTFDEKTFNYDQLGENLQKARRTDRGLRDRSRPRTRVSLSAPRTDHKGRRNCEVSLR